MLAGLECERVSMNVTNFYPSGVLVDCTIPSMSCTPDSRRIVIRRNKQTPPFSFNPVRNITSVILVQQMSFAGTPDIINNWVLFIMLELLSSVNRKIDNRDIMYMC